jgi:hypothetical protein
VPAECVYLGRSDAAEFAHGGEVLADHERSNIAVNMWVILVNVLFCKMNSRGPVLGGMVCWVTLTPASSGNVHSLVTRLPSRVGMDRAHSVRHTAVAGVNCGESAVLISVKVVLARLHPGTAHTTTGADRAWPVSRLFQDRSS